MAHKSKTQQAKAAARKQNRKDRQEREEAAGISTAAEGGAAEGSSDSKATVKNADKPAKQQVAAASKKESKPRKTRFQFFKDVRAEMKRVTWPSKTDVMRWTGVVVGALLFFGIYVAVLDNAIITPALIGLTSLGA